MAKRTWSQALIDQEQKRLADELAVAADGMTSTQFLSHLKSRAEAVQKIHDGDGIELLLLIFMQLTHHSEYGGLTNGEIETLRKTAEGLLHLNGVRSGISTFSYLFGDLRAALAAIKRREGDHWGAAWQQEMGFFLARRAPSGGRALHALEVGANALRLGQLETADKALALAARESQILEWYERATLLRVRCLRLAGRREEAASLAAELQAKGMTALTASARTWEEARRTASEDHDLEPMIEELRQRKDRERAAAIMEARLWSVSLPIRKWEERVPALKEAKTILTTHKSAELGLFYELMVSFEQCQDSDRPLVQRLDTLGMLLDQISGLNELDWELLFLAASARFLLRAKQPSMAAAVAGRYRTRCEGMTKGRSPDCLGLLKDMKGPTEILLEDLEKGMLPDPAQDPGEAGKSWLGRTADMARLGTSVSTRLLARRFKTMVTGKPKSGDAEPEKMSKELGWQLFEALGSAKGMAMKLAQQASSMPSGMSEGTRQHLLRLLDASPPMPLGKSEDIIRSELGKAPTELYAEWQSKPLATGSIGQVHCAKTKDGMDVVVKVQYPASRANIANDFKTLRVAAPMLKKMFPGVGIDALIDEANDIANGECDYLKEASYMNRFREAFQFDPLIYVPEPIAELTTSRVLTMERADAIGFFPYVQSASKEDKQRTGRAIYKYIYKAIFQHLILNGDPHYGNFLFDGDKIYVIDFGSVKEFDPNFMQVYREMMLAGMRGEKKKFFEKHVEVGFVGSKDFDLEVGYEIFRSTVLLPYVSPQPYTFNHADIRRDFDLTITVNPNISSINLPKDLLLFTRLHWGANTLLAELGATADWRAIIEEILTSPVVSADKKAG